MVGRNERQALNRVARAMGESEGTGPEDDPLSRMLIHEGRAEGRLEGRAEGHHEGRAEMVLAALRARGIESGAGLAEELPALAREAPAEALMAVALACTDEADFRRRVREET